MNKINLDGQIGGWWGITAEWLRSKLPKDKSEPVTLVLNTPGGDVFEGFAIHQLLNEYSDLTVEIGAMVASAGSYAILSAKKVIARETSTIMIHKAWSFTMGDSEDMDKQSEILSGIDTMIAKTYAKKTKSTQKKMLKAMADETWLFGGEAIKAFGFADEVIEEETESEIDEPFIKASVASALRNFKNELTGIKMGDKRPDSNNLSNSITKEEPELKKDKDNQPENTNQAPRQDPEITEADVQAAVEAGVLAERERVSGLLNLANVSMSDSLSAAVSSDTTQGDYAIAHMQANRTMPKSNTDTIGTIAPAKEVKDTVVDDIKQNEQKINEQAAKQVAIMKGE